jgi:mannose-6-phosphate isomerase-like protein (cupin superfamily)
MTTLGSQSVHISRGEDRTKLLWTGGTVFDVVLGGGRTGGALALLDQWAVRGDATPLHVHRAEAEIFYVLEGGITAWHGDTAHEIGAGGVVYLPAGQPHAFAVRTERARLITVTAPGGFADFVTEAGIPVEGDAPSTWEFDIGRIMRAAPAHDIDVLGPPPVLTTADERPPAG